MSKKAIKHKLTMNKSKIHNRKRNKAMMTKNKTQMNNKKSHSHQSPRLQRTKNPNHKPLKPNPINLAKRLKRKSNSTSSSDYIIFYLLKFYLNPTFTLTY